MRLARRSFLAGAAALTVSPLYAGPPPAAMGVLVYDRTLDPQGDIGRVARELGLAPVMLPDDIGPYVTKLIAQQSFPAAGVTRPSVLFIVEQLAMRQGLAIACRFEPRCYNRGSWRHRPHPGNCDHAAIRRFQTAMSAVTAPSAVGWMIA